jgi:hypothetical protein
LEKKVLAFEHELERTNESGSETRKELQISLNNIEKLSGKVREGEEQLK